MTVAEQGQRLQLELTGMGRLGEAMAEVEGKPVFVFGGIPGEEVVAEVIRERRHYIAAHVLEVRSRSPHRVEPPCEYFGDCTGCQWQHIDYQHQLTMKRDAVVDALRRIGGLPYVSVEETLPSPRQFGYRNHARFTVGRREGVLGFVHREKRRYVEVEQCLLMDQWINRTLEQLRGHCSETSQIALRYGTRTGDWLIQPALHSPTVPLATGQKHYRDVVSGTTFRVSSPSFFQVNTLQTERMVDWIRKALRLDGSETVVDAYAGVGTFSALLAPHAAKVIAIEESAAAIQDARENLAPFRNVAIHKATTEDALNALGRRVDVVILDPPRAGCGNEALDALRRLAPGRVVYVSCDAETLARDLKTLAAGAFRIDAVQPLDMFPQTYHVECLALLRLREGHPVTLASSSPRRASILESAGLPFSTVAPKGDETPPGRRDPADYVQALALEKARQVSVGVQRGVVLAADTVVVHEGRVVGKPVAEDEAMAMLRSLRGREHLVLTGVVAMDATSGRYASGTRVSRVLMREYSDQEAWAFVASGSAMDKAGAYAVQDESFVPAESVTGCYLNVVGLPLCLAIAVLREMGVEVDGIRLPAECTAGPEGAIA